MFLTSLHDWLTPKTPLEVVAAVAALLAAMFAVISEGGTQEDGEHVW